MGTIADKLKNKIRLLTKEGFFHILIGDILVKMIAFLSSIVIVRLVSKQDYGYLGYADNLYQYVILLSGLGLSTALLKFCSPEKEKGKNKFFYSLALKVGVLFQLAASVILVIGAYVTDIPFPDARGLILTLLLYPAMMQLVATLQCYIRSQLNNKLYAKMGVIQTVAVFLTSIPLAYFAGVYGVAIARYIAMAIIIVIALKFIRGNLPANIQTVRPPKEEVTFFWKIAVSMMLANLFSMIMPINEMFLINTHIRDEIVTANYKVAILIPSQITFITSAVVVYFFPKVAQMSDRLHDALRTTVKIEVLLLLIMGVVCLAGYFISPVLIRLVYGERYADAIELSKIYWLVYGLNAGFRMLPMNVLPAIGSTTFNTSLSVISCAVHALVLHLFLAQYGIWGAPYALILIYFVSGCAYWIYLTRKCRKA